MRALKLSGAVTKKGEVRRAHFPEIMPEAPIKRQPLPFAWPDADARCAIVA